MSGGWLDIVRYILALLFVISFPLIAFWFFIHPFVGFWRRIGSKTAYVTAGTIVVLPCVALFFVRERVLAVDYGAVPLLWPFALLSYVTSITIEVKCRRHLTLKLLIGVPELNPDQSGRRLLTRGIYGRMRHPRYVGIFLGLLAFALFTNFLAMYLLIPIVGVMLFLVAILEERELIATFGEEYERYRARVPRFFPKLGATHRV
jgi:protein-S-isoprenylcysteine O-methyltransferase Ste14